MIPPSPRLPRPGQARKRFGQHFLERPSIDKIIAAVAPQPGETFLESDPDEDSSPVPLARAGVIVHAVEIDRDLVAELRPGPAERPRARRRLPRGPGRDLVRRRTPLPRRREPPVQRVDARPRQIASSRPRRTPGGRRPHAPEGGRRPPHGATGYGDYGPLAIAMALQADVSRVFVLPPGAFRPPPKVHSAVVHLVFHPDRVAIADHARLDAIVRHVFTQRRKMLGTSLHALAKGEGADARAWLAEAGIDGTRRAETLSPGGVRKARGSLGTVGAVIGQAGVRPSAFGHRPSESPSAFGVRRSAFGVRRSSTRHTRGILLTAVGLSGFSPTQWV